MAATIERLAREVGGFVRLAREITKRYHRDQTGRLPKKDVVDRRKLSDIAKGQLVHFAPTELLALDLYLERHGEGLAQQPLFQKPRLLQAFADSSRVTFLLGSRLDTDLKRAEYSQWDVNACTFLMRVLDGFGTNVRFDIEEVRRGAGEAEARRATRSSWAKRLDDEGRSLICLGSPRANHASELTLARMAGVEPHVRADDDPVPPFRFVWRKHMPFPSAFAEPPESLPSADRAVLGKDDYAVYLGDRFVPTHKPTKKKARKTFGIVAAQRRPSGQVWLVIAGLNGAATYGSALAVTDVEESLERPEYCWTPVEVLIRENPRTGLYDIRKQDALQTYWV